MWEIWSKHRLIRVNIYTNKMRRIAFIDCIGLLSQAAKSFYHRHFLQLTREPLNARKSEFGKNINV